MPGRTWQPPESYLGSEEAKEPFTALLQDGDMRTSKLDLSGTLPQCIALFDAWLEHPVFKVFHAGCSWRGYFRQHVDAIRLARLQFLARLEEAA